MQTPGEIPSLIISGVKSFYRGISIKHQSPATYEIPEKQKLIEWENLVRGKITTSFQQYMNLHYSRRKCKSFSGKGWIKEVLKFIIYTHTDTWKYYCNKVLNQTK